MHLFGHAHQPAHQGGMNLASMLAMTAPPAAGGGVTLGADVLSCNLHLLPPHSFGMIAGYETQVGGGTGFIAWTDAQWAEYPDAVRIAQLPSGDPVTADVLDFEAGAATVTELATWAKGAQESYAKAVRPGQRMPTVYCSASNVHVMANALVDGGVKGGVGIGLANWNLTEPQAAADVINRSGPFPIVFVQWSDAGNWDLDVFSTAWLNTRSGKPPAPLTYGPPRNLKAAGGHTSALFTWSPPGTPGLPDPAGYDLYVYTSPACTRSSLVPTWGPRRPGPVTSYQGGSLERGRTYYARVVATGPGGKHVNAHAYAQVKFTTG